MSHVSIDGRHGYIDSTGVVRIDAEWDEATSFSEGLAGVRTGALWGFVDSDGEVAIGPAFSAIGRFSEGLCAVALPSDDEIRWGFIDREGKLVIEPRYSNWVAPIFSGGIALVQIAESRPDGRAGYSSGYINRRGRWAYKPIEGPWYFPVG